MDIDELAVDHTLHDGPAQPCQSCDAMEADGKPFDFDSAIQTVQQQIDSETEKHEKRMEFWKGYQAAMREVRDHI